MALTVTMPQLGESVTEGTIARWLKQPGEHVARYESIAEVITDKVNAEIPAPADGTMAELIAPEGAVVAVGQPICSIETDVAVPTPEAPAGAPAASPPQSTSPPQVPPPAPVVPASAAPQIAAAASAATGGNGAASYHLTPAVRMLVREHSVDLSQVQGSGIGGRVTKKDVLEYVQRRDSGAPAAPQPMSAPQPTSAPQVSTPAPAGSPSVEVDGVTLVPLTPTRRAIAEHMVRSRHTSPHAWVLVEVDMSAVARVRERARAEFEQRYGVKLTYLPFVARAVCEALRIHPTLNASWSDDGILLKRDIHLGIAVALPDNLVVPVVRNADRLSIAGLATTMADLGERARTNHLKLDEIQGGTFTLNNTGALGAVMTQAIINQPQAAILTMDAIVKRPVVVEGDAIAVRAMMNLGLSFDHRINDGLPATRFVKTVKDLLEATDERTTIA